MKRYEKMSKEDIINVIECFAGQVEGPSKIALDALNDMLTKEVEMKPRFMTIKSVEEMENELRVFTCMCANMNSCEECQFHKTGQDMTACLVRYLCEEVEATE